MRRSIRAKFVLGFVLIFSVSFLLLNLLVGRIIDTSNQNIITGNLIDLKNNSNVYVRQAYMVHHFTNDEVYFGQMAEEMVQDLRYATSSEVAMYSSAGELLHASDGASFASGGDDLAEALRGRTAYTIVYQDGTASVRFAYPVVINGAKVGILRFAKEFTLLYEQSEQIMNTIFMITMAVFAAAFLFSYLLSRHISRPLAGLAKASTEVMNGNLDVRIASRGRRDEIGRLADNFNSMIGKIGGQLATIERDRDRLQELNAQRKQFYDNVTHELKTPLTTILGYAEIIRRNGASDRDFFDKGMSHIVDESKRLHDMVLRLLEVSKGTAGGDFEPVDAGRLLRDVCEAMTIKAERYNKTIRCTAAEGVYVSGQADRLRQLFINLIDNAIKYGAAHTEIRADARLADERAEFAVASFGETIAPEQLARIFEPFYRAGRAAGPRDGSGLGLGICRGIVDEHRGVIRMTSENGETTVRIEMPREQAAGRELR